MKEKKSRLGRGLDDLMPIGIDKILPEKASKVSGSPLMTDIKLIDPNPDQPREDFNESELHSLAQSIKADGIIQPLVVSQKDDKRYELIAGERRLKAATLAGLTQVPVIIKDLSKDPAERLRIALFENICRKDLNPIEEAKSFLRLEEEFGYTHQEIATKSGRERPTITNSVRLLKLPDYIQHDIRENRLSAGHGRAMLGLGDHSLFQQLRSEVVAKSLTVRQTEALVKKLNRKPGTKPFGGGDEAYFEALAKSFSNQLGGLKVNINHTGKTKKLEIYYTSNEELEWLMKKVGTETVS